MTSRAGWLQIATPCGCRTGQPQDPFDRALLVQGRSGQRPAESSTRYHRVAMRRLATNLFAVAAVLLPAASALSHLDTDLHPPFGGQELVVTGHDDLDPTLHMEAPSGLVLVQCPECVLDKRQSGAHQEAKPALTSRSSERRTLFEEPASRSLELASSGSPRAPPLV